MQKPVEGRGDPEGHDAGGGDILSDGLHGPLGVCVKGTDGSPVAPEPSYNHVTLLGRVLGHVRAFGATRTGAEFVVETVQRGNANRPERRERHTVVGFEAVAQRALQTVTDGALVLVTGALIHHNEHVIVKANVVSAIPTAPPRRTEKGDS